MINCKGCKYWISSSRKASVWGECRNKRLSESGISTHFPVIEVSNREHYNFPFDKMRTVQSFGCVLGESRR